MLRKNLQAHTITVLSIFFYTKILFSCKTNNKKIRKITQLNLKIKIKLH